MKKQPNTPKPQSDEELHARMHADAIKTVLDRYRKKRIVFDKQFISEMYPMALDNYVTASRVYSHIKVNPFEVARSSDVVEFICEFHLMNISGMPEQQVSGMQRNTEYRAALARDVGKAMFFVEHVIDDEGRGIDRYNPLVVFPSVLFNYLLTVLRSLDGRNVFLGSKRELLNNLYQYMILQLQSIMELLTINIKDAVCLWRNLHETECIATVLYKNDESVAEDFLYFQKFAFIDEYESDKPEVVEINELYNDFKKNYREMKATRDEFREKGWLRGAIGFNAEHGFNVKRGLQPMAGLEDRYQAYRTASKIVHPSGITFNTGDGSLLLFAYEQLLLTTDNLLTQIAGLSGEDKPDIFDRETSTLRSIINAYFNLYKRGLSAKKPDDEPLL